MLRTLRERWWYMLLWLPLCTALGFLGGWLWVIFQIIGGWTIRYDAAPKWGFLSAGTFALLILFIVLLFPRKPARSLKVAASSVIIVAFLLWILFYASTNVVSYEVRDVDGRPLEGIPIHVTHHANGVALTWFPGEVLLRTDKHGEAAIRIFKCEQCDANVNDLLGKGPGCGNSQYSDDNAFFTSASVQAQMGDLPFGRNDIVEHSYMLEFQNGPPSISQRCLELLPNSVPKVVRVYLRHRDSPKLPPYFDEVVDQGNADLNYKKVRLMSLGGSIQSFNHLDELLSADSQDDSQQDAALYSMGLLALQIREISSSLPGLSLDFNTPQSRYRPTNDQRLKCSQILYVWLSGKDAPPPLSHDERIAYIKQRMDQAVVQLINALHPVMLKKKAAYSVLGELQQAARPAMKYYPEVFERGTDEAKEGALEVIGPIAPSAQDVAFLLRSKKPTWIECAGRISLNSTAAELADDLKTLETLKSQESDGQNIAAFDQVIKLVGDQLARNQAEEANKPSSSVEPRYVVIDLGTEMLHPKKITNSGYVLGYNKNSYYVWFDGAVTVLKPKNVGDAITVDDIDESGTVLGSESVGDLSESPHHSIKRAVWEKGSDVPKLMAQAVSSPGSGSPSVQDQIHAMNLPQITNSPVVPAAVNAAVALLPTQADSPARLAQLVPATQVIGNGPGGGYLWEMTPTLSETKTFEGPFLINALLPGEPKTSPWTVTSVANINDGGAVIGTAVYKPTGPNDLTAAGLHSVMLMPLAIVRESPPGSGDFEPIVDNGLDDNATIPIFTSAPPNTPNSSTPETDGQGIFYIQMPGSIPGSITLKSGNNHVTVKAMPVAGRPNLLRTGKLVLIDHGDPFRASDITTIEAGTPNDGGTPTLELQKYDRTIVK